MKGLITLTHLLFPILIGLIVGAAIGGSTSILVFGIILLIVDIIIGIVLQYLVNKETYKDDWNNLSLREKESIVHDILEEIQQNMRDKGMDVDGMENALSNKFDSIYLELKIDGGARITNNINADEAGILLLDVCNQMPYAPHPASLNELGLVSIEDLDDNRAIVYYFNYVPQSICQNAIIFLVHSEVDEIRLFTVETDITRFVLCEYSNGHHLNYGRVELKDVPTKIKKILAY